MTREQSELPTLSVRKASIVRLLETRDDGLPTPVRRADAPAGFVHVVVDARGREANEETCPDCLANDRAMFGCETCGGSGRVRAPRSRDPYAVNTITPYGLDGSRLDAARERDIQIDRMEAQLAPPRSEAELLAEANKYPYGWEREREQMWKRFDYKLLDRVLDELRTRDPIAYRALHAVYVYRWLHQVDGLAAAACERGLAFLSPRLAACEVARGGFKKQGELRRPLRAPGVEAAAVNLVARGRAADPRALAQRDEAVRRAIADRQSTAAVAAEFGLSVSQVNRIVSRAA